MHIRKYLKSLYFNGSFYFRTTMRERKRSSSSSSSVTSVIFSQSSYSLPAPRALLYAFRHTDLDVVERPQVHATNKRSHFPVRTETNESHQARQLGVRPKATIQAKSNDHERRFSSVCCLIQAFLLRTSNMLWQCLFLAINFASNLCFLSV